MNMPFSETVLKDLAYVDPYAVEQLAGFGGPGIFNPLIGQNAAETCEKIEKMAGLLHHLLDKGNDITEIQDAVSLLVEGIWMAAQYEGFRSMPKEKASG
jgi:hypothetical protein